MMNVNILAITAMITGVAVSAMWFPQSYKLIKRKSAKDISLPTFVMLAIALFVWLIYGITLDNYPIIATNSLGLIGVLLIIAATLKYKK